MTTNNHPAHGPISLDRLHQIREILSKAAAQSDGGDLGYAMADAVKVIDEVLSIPATLPCPVHLEPGLKFGKGVRTQCVLDALRRRADYYAELEAMTPEQRAEHDAGIAEFKAMLGNGSRAAMLQAEPVIHPYKLPPNSFTDEDLEMMAHGDNPQSNAYRELLAFRRNSQGIGNDSTNGKPLTSGYIAANSPVTPDGWVLVPKRLTAENGAKGVLSGEFSETKYINCPECFGDDECETCDGSGRIEITVPVTWTTIKAIWAKGVEHFAAAPQQEADNG